MADDRDRRELQQRHLLRRLLSDDRAGERADTEAGEEEAEHVRVRVVAEVRDALDAEDDSLRDEVDHARGDHDRAEQASRRAGTSRRRARPSAARPPRRASRRGRRSRSRGRRRRTCSRRRRAPSPGSWRRSAGRRAQARRAASAGSRPIERRSRSRPPARPPPRPPGRSSRDEAKYGAAKIPIAKVVPSSAANERCPVRGGSG